MLGTLLREYYIGREPFARTVQIRKNQMSFWLDFESSNIFFSALFRTLFYSPRFLLFVALNNAQELRK